MTAALPATLSAWAAGPFDGTYRTIRNDNSGNCDKLDISVAADGTVAGSTNHGQNVRSQCVIRFADKITGGVMEGEYGHDKCAATLTLRKV